MGHKGDRTRTRMVESMLSHIQTSGYAGSGVSAVLADAEAPKGSLYFHFPDGKESLGEHAIALAAERFDALVTHTTTTASTPADAVHLVVDALCDMLTTSDYELGCPVSVVTLEMGGTSERLRGACQDAFTKWISSVASALHRDGADPESSHALATTVVAAIEGATILSRARRDTQPLRDAASVMGIVLASAVQAGPQNRAARSAALGS